ncbi:RAMP superfamily CRISPR-associated protein [Coleofasciculus sp.]|uniref:RAMP superfamily CRISPR-associated protein n=1 Tax=Coleofasciculus sp. TaxID=3100458 RepID=UPI003A1D3F5F
MTIAWLICQEPVHIGGADSSSRGNNNPIFRLPDRTPAIPGSSLRGALREHAESQQEYQPLVKNWFGGKEDISAGHIALGWGWTLWWPIHVLGYGNWWVSCLSWLNRFQQLSHQSPLNLDPNKVYITEEQLKDKTVYLRWLKLNNVQHCTDTLPRPEQIPENRLIIVPDDSINIIVDMGLVRQPRVSLKNLDEIDQAAERQENPDENTSLVNNLFSVEGFPPGAVFLISWTARGKVDNLEKWKNFLVDEHFLGGLWSVGYGRIQIYQIE